MSKDLREDVAMFEPREELNKLFNRNLVNKALEEGCKTMKAEMMNALIASRRANYNQGHGSANSHMVDLGHWEGIDVADKVEV